MSRYSIVVVVGLFLLYLTPFQAGAQRIYFSDTTNKWRTKWTLMVDPGVWYSYMYHHYASDTLVESNSHSYTEIKGAGGTGFEQFLVREDTSAGLVFLKARSRMGGSFHRVKDTNEFVYMNYNLHVGDTLIMPLVYTRNDDDSISIHVVTSIDSFFVNGLRYRKFKLDAYRGMGIGPNGNYPTWYTIYEGIGPDSGPFIESSPSGGEWGPTELICFSNRGDIPPIFNQNCFDPLGISEPGKTTKCIVYYPNPASGQLKVKDQERSGRFYTLKITDLSGKVLQQEVFRNEATLDLHALPPGLYFLQFLKGTAIIQSEKFIINR